MQNSATPLRQDEDQLSLSHQIYHILIIDTHLFLAARADRCNRNNSRDKK